MPQLLQTISPHSGSVTVVLSLLHVKHVITVFFSSISSSIIFFTVTSNNRISSQYSIYYYCS